MCELDFDEDVVWKNEWKCCIRGCSQVVVHCSKVFNGVIATRYTVCFCEEHLVEPLHFARMVWTDLVLNDEDSDDSSDESSENGDSSPDDPSVADTVVTRIGEVVKEFQDAILEELPIVQETQLEKQESSDGISFLLTRLPDVSNGLDWVERKCKKFFRNIWLRIENVDAEEMVS